VRGNNKGKKIREQQERGRKRKCKPTSQEDFLKKRKLSSVRDARGNGRMLKGKMGAWRTEKKRQKAKKKGFICSGSFQSELRQGMERGLNGEKKKKNGRL